VSHNNGLCLFIVQNQILSDSLQSVAGSKLGSIGAAVQHEGGTPGSLSSLGPQVDDDTNGRDLSRIVENNLNGYSAEEVAKEHPVSDITPSSMDLEGWLWFNANPQIRKKVRTWKLYEAV